jgi:hypothetical protein
LSSCVLVVGFWGLKWPFADAISKSPLLMPFLKNPIDGAHKWAFADTISSSSSPHARARAHTHTHTDTHTYTHKRQKSAATLTCDPMADSATRPHGLFLFSGKVPRMRCSLRLRTRCVTHVCIMHAQTHHISTYNIHEHTSSCDTHAQALYTYAHIHHIHAFITRTRARAHTHIHT